jgi:hypothetical protein
MERPNAPFKFILITQTVKQKAASKGFCGCHFEPAIEVEMSKL